MNQSSSNHLSDQVVGVCPFGCNGKCPKLWINEEIGHKCDCTTCHSARVYPEEWYTSVDKYFVKNCTAERVAVGEWRGLPDTTSPPTEFIPNSYLDTTGNKTYSDRNSTKQVPQVEGLPEQQQTTMTPSHVVKVIAQ